MMSDPFGFADGLKEIESEFGQMFRWNGVDYPCLMGEDSVAKTLGFGGYNGESDLQIIARTAIFPEGELPEVNQDVTANGRGLTIQSITKPPGAAFIVLACIDRNKGT